VKRALLILPLAALLAGCSGGGSPTPTITIEKPKTYELIDRSPAKAVAPGKPTTVGFTVRLPSGKPLTKFKTGPGPHTGIHVIIVKDDLSTIIHRHPPIAPDGHVSEQVVLPTPGNYIVLADVYPRRGPIPNYQLRYDLHAKGTEHFQQLPKFQAVQTVDGYRVDLHGTPNLRVAVAKILKITVTAPNGKPAPFDVWYGALAHAIFFQLNTLAYFHTHVCGPNTPGCTSILGQPTIQAASTKPGVLHAGLLLPGSGTWELFLQFKSSGKIVTVPYTLKVRA
jgi:hypothetical protein